MNNQTNAPDYAAQETDRLALDYAELRDRVQTVLEQTAATMPAKVADDTDFERVSKAVVEMRDLGKHIEAIREQEKAPHYRRGQGVDAFFGTLRDGLAKLAGEIAARGDVYRKAKMERERIERERKAREERERAEAARRAAEEASRKAADAAAAAARARKAETVEQRTSEAAGAAVVAAEARIGARAAQEAADAALKLAEASAADLSRQRFGSGHMVTAKQVPHVEITNYNILPLELLRPYIRRADLEHAVKQYARMTEYKVQVPGAVIEMRDATVYR